MRPPVSDRRPVSLRGPELTQIPGLAGPYSDIMDALSDSAPYPDLADLGNRVDAFTRQMLAGPVDLPHLLSTISGIHDTLTARIIAHHEAGLETADGLKPPSAFCWISMGSEARQEQVVRTDQDNALIFRDPGPGKSEAADTYFSRLADRVVTDLDRFGFKRCKGEVMATNPVWRRSLPRWIQVLDRWVGSAEPEDVRKLTILLDFRPVYGDTPLAGELWSAVFDLFRKNPVVSHYLTRDDNLFAAPRNFWGRIRTRRRQNCRACFNIKTSGLAHLINGIRILALNHEIRHPATLDRLAELRDRSVISVTEYRDFREAFMVLNRLKIESHLNREGQPENCVDIAGLDTGTRTRLEKALDAVGLLQKRIHRTYNVAWMNFFN